MNEGGVAGGIEFWKEADTEEGWDEYIVPPTTAGVQTKLMRIVFVGYTMYSGFNAINLVPARKCPFQRQVKLHHPQS